MPRPIDLSQAPPPQAVCHACRSEVKLSARARQQGLFRCPICHADNRVGPDGVGQPLRGPSLDPESMPLQRCPACGSVNRLPFEVLRAGRYTCHQCRRVGRVSRALRRRAGITSPWPLVVTVAVTLLALVWSGVQMVTTYHRYRDNFGPPKPSLATLAEDLVIDDPRVLGPRADGNRYEVTGRVYNRFGHPVTFHVKAQLVNGGEPFLTTVHSVLNVPPGEWKPFTIPIVDPQRRPASAVYLDLAGVS